jgi:hypothetical protein
MHHFRHCLLMMLLLCSFATSNAQTRIEVLVTVVDGGQEALPLASVLFTELGAGAQLKASTDVNGEATVVIESAGEWKLSINGHDPGLEPIIVKEGESGKSAFFVTWSPALDARKRRQSFDRSGLEEVPMSLRIPAAPAEGWNLVEIQVQGSSGRRVPGSTVALVDLAGRKRYTASTAADGIARFHLPGGRPYDIDVEEHLNAAHLLMEDRIDHTLGQTVIYDAYDIIEKRRNDTILQAFKMPLQQKASRALYRIRVQKNGKAWTKGTVLLDATGSRDVYTARTDSSGTAVFILPFGKALPRTLSLPARCGRDQPA